MTKQILAAAVILLLALSACANRRIAKSCEDQGYTPDTTAYTECVQREKQAYKARRGDKLAKFAKNCTGYGFTAGTDAFAACVQREKHDYRARKRAAWGALSSPPQPGFTCTTTNNITTCW